MTPPPDQTQSVLKPQAADSGRSGGGVTWVEWSEKLFSQVRSVIVVTVGVGILAGLCGTSRWLERTGVEEQGFQKDLAGIVEQSASARERLSSMEALKKMDLEQLKAGLNGSALSQKTLFETGLSLQEERRLLDKQLEIMTTYLLVNPGLQRIFLMRDDQPLQSYLIGYVPLHAYGGATPTLPSIVRIVSKERFAHPERGKSEQVNGQLQWIPPQVGTSVRSKALGEFVMFTNSALILHGPPLDEKDHERFPHICIGLDRSSARKLYRGSFIGTKIALSHIFIEQLPVPPPLEPGNTQTIRTP